MYANFTPTFFRIAISFIRHSLGNVLPFDFNNSKLYHFGALIRHFIREAFCKDRKLSQILEIGLFVLDCTSSPTLLNLMFECNNAESSKRDLTLFEKL